MGKTLFSFSTGILLGFAAGVMIDSEKRKKLQALAKSQTERLKGYEKSFQDGINKIKSLVSEKSTKKAKK